MFMDGRAYGLADGRTDRLQAHRYIPPNLSVGV